MAARPGAGAGAPPGRRAPRPVVVLLGDSLTQRGGAVAGGAPGWAARLGELYARRADVVNRGLSGYNTRWVLPELPVLLGGAAAGAALVVVWLGANDAALSGGDSAAQHVPLAEYRDNLRAILGHVKALPGNPLALLITPPPVHETSRLRFTGGAAPERTIAAAAAYARACLEVAQETDTLALSLWDGLMEGGSLSWEEMLCDGLHLSPSGEELVYDLVVKAIEGTDLAPSALPMDVPDWKDLASGG